MSGDIGFTLFDKLINVADSVIASTYDTVMGAWPAVTIVTLYVVSVGYMVITGRTGERTKEWAFSVILLATISTLCSNYATFDEFFFGPVYDAFYNLASIGATGGTGGFKETFTATENAVGTIIETLDTMNLPGGLWDNAWLYFKASAAALILGLLAAISYAVFVALMCIAVFSLMVVTAAGGPCLWLVCFKETRFITWTWMKAVFNYGMWMFFLGLVGGISGACLQQAAKNLGNYEMANGVFTREYGFSVLICCLSIYMLLKASDWAAALTGGSSTNTGIIGAAGSMIGSATGSAGAAAAGRVWNSKPAAMARGWAGDMASAGAARAYSALRGLGK